MGGASKFEGASAYIRGGGAPKLEGAHCEEDSA